MTTLIAPSLEVQVVAGERPLREVNHEIRSALAAGSDVTVSEPMSRHNLAVALTGAGRVRLRGSVGYYCGGLSAGPDIHVEGNAGWGVGEALASGFIRVDGNAGMSAGASMRGGTVHIRGNAGPRTGIAMKGGNLVVEGDVGYSSGFMAHGGRLVVCGDALASIADSLWMGSVWVAGEIKSLGIDAKVVEPPVDELLEVEELLTDLGVPAADRDWKKIVSAEGLWYFEARDAKKWLMI
jgi:methylamine---glutamate N-methyltransferase subunit B